MVVFVKDDFGFWVYVFYCREYEHARWWGVAEGGVDVCYWWHAAETHL